MTPHEFHLEAEIEMLAQADYYEFREPGLGTRFLLAVGRAIERLKFDPAAGRRPRLICGGNPSRTSSSTCCISTNRIAFGSSRSLTTVARRRTGGNVSDGNSHRGERCSSTAIF